MSSMGFLGAMAGLGQGMQHYSTLLGEKRKEDWKEQAEMAKAQRAENLAKKQNEWLAKRETDSANLTQTHRLGLLEATNKAAIDQIPLETEAKTEAELKRLNDHRVIAAEKAAQERGLAYKVDEWKAESKVLQERVEIQAAFARKWDKEERVAKWRETEASGVLDGLSEAEILKIKMATIHPELIPLLKDKQVPAEVLSKMAGIFEKVYTESYDKYDSLSDQERMKIDSAAKTVEQDPREYFASSQALYVTDLASKSLGFGSPGVSVNNDKERKQTIQDVASGETTVQDLLDAGVAVDVVEKIAKEAGVPFEAPAVTEAPTLKTGPNKVDNTRKSVDAMRARLGLPPLNHSFPEIFRSLGDVNVER